MFCRRLTTAVIAVTCATSAYAQQQKDQSEGATCEIVAVRKIWDKAPHNAFTDLVRHQGRWWCVFREGKQHVSPDGALRVITSADGETWESAALLESASEDLRDPKLGVMPDGRFMLLGAGALHEPRTRQSYVWFSQDGRTWTDAVPVADPNYWLWRVTWHKGVSYGIGYHCTEKGVRLYRSRDGRRFETLVEDLGVDRAGGETSIIFLPDDTAVCLLRCDPEHGLLGTARPPYEEWKWNDVGFRIGGPHMLQLPDGRIIAAVRHEGTELCWVNLTSGKLEPCLRLPSGGDTSYAGLVWHDCLLWVSYYSSHEGKTSIYLAKVRPSKVSAPP